MLKSIRSYSWGCVITSLANLIDSFCDKQVVRTLSNRTHHCGHCGIILDRDHNASLNILAIGRLEVRVYPN
ncbi:transposase [Pseudanabaena cinerea]|uniref:transposase n=1 Tax=Pseudanabaena cinerea TaxID=2661616 RepID=UPI001F55A32F|nr:transposase [Pseudanabaena cinerea]